MARQSSTQSIEVSAPAKINLFLQVVGRRDDGYHELRTLMCCLGLHDTLILHMGTDRCQINCSDPELPCDKSNLAMKAALVFNQALTRRTSVTARNLSINLIKRIPVGAGLGGGSLVVVGLDVISSVAQFEIQRYVGPPTLRQASFEQGA